MANLVGQRLGNRYLIEAEIGRGGMGVVYRALDTSSLQRTVAIKLPLAGLLTEENFLERFLHEARQAASLHHPNIVTIYDIGEQEGVPFIVMQYLDGQTLEKILDRRGPLPVEQTAPLLRQLADALDYVHGQRLVHRDIKTANVMLSADGKVTLTDFGLVRAAESAGFTRSHQTVGTAEFMSPEQALGRPSDPRSDNYSLGVVAYKMLTGHVPFERETSVATLVAHASEAPPSPRTFRSDLNRPLEAVLAKALAKSPDERYQRAGQFAADLATAATGRWPVIPRPVTPTQKLSPLPAVRHSPSPQPLARPSPHPAPASRLRLLASRLTITQMLAGTAVLFICALLTSLLWTLNPGGNPTPTPAASATPGATVPAGPTDTPTSAPPATKVTLSATPASVTATVTETAATPDGSFTATLAPSPTTQVPTKTSTPSGNNVIATDEPLSPPSTPSVPVPTAPLERETGLTGRVRFAWDYSGELQPGQAFEVRIWAAGQEHLGAAEATTDREQTINLDVAPGIKANNLASGEYLWAVAVIKKATGARIGRESEPRRFIYGALFCEGDGCR